MKEIWKELVNSLGFTVSAVLLLLVVPIGFINAFGMLTSVGGVFVLILFAGGIMVYRFVGKHNQESAVEAIKSIHNGTATEQQKSKFLAIEIAEMEQKEKQEHILRLPLQYDMYSLYHWGHPRESLKKGFSKKQNSVSSARVLELLRADICNQFSKNVSSDLTFLFRRGGTFTPVHLLSEAVENLMKKKKCNRKYAEKHFAEELKFIRWQVTYCCLKSIFGGYGSVARVELKEDMSGYSLTYPFGLPPLEYCFLSDEEEEKKFVQAAIERLEECKEIVRNIKSDTKILDDGEISWGFARFKVCYALGCTSLDHSTFVKPQNEYEQKDSSFTDGNEKWSFVRQESALSDLSPDMEKAIMSLDSEKKKRCEYMLEFGAPLKLSDVEHIRTLETETELTNFCRKILLPLK